MTPSGRGTSWSFRELDELSNAFARHLAGRGVGAGDRVAVMTSNRLEFVAAVHAISKLGAAAVLLSPAWKATEVGHALELTGPVHAVADAEAAALLAGIARRRTGDRPRRRGDGSLRARPRPAATRTAAGGTAEAVLVFSSGTTGLPKAVRHTHGSIGHATEHWREVLGLGPDDRFQVATPPSHILGLLNLLAAVAAGATVRLHRRFDLDEVLRRIASERMTLEMAVAPIALAMANHPRLEDYDLSSLRYIMWGATPVTESVARIVTERTGVRWLPAYGASEVPVIAANPVDRPESWRLDSAGLPPAGVELRVADLESGEVLDPGEIGEIQVRSPSVMAGYLPDEATADAFADGWYRTGDVGWLEPEGWVHLTDRSKEMIKVSGFQVAPAEVEAVLLPASRRARLRGVRRRRRAGRRGAGGRGAARPGPAAGRRRARAARRRLAGHLQAASPRRRRRRDPAAPFGQGAAAHAPRRVVAAAGRTDAGRLMDVRLSPEQQALRDAAAQVVDRLGPKAVGAARRPRAGGQARCRRRRVRVAGAAVAAEGGGPLASGVEAAIVAEELGRGAGRRLVPRTDPGRRAPPAGRRAAGSAVETVALDTRLSSLVRGVGGEWPAAVAIDAQGSSRALLLAHDRRGLPPGRGRAAAPRRRARPHPPLAVLDPSSPVTLVEGADRP